MALYKRRRGDELRIQTGIQSKRDPNSGSLNFKSDAQTTRPRCLLIMSKVTRLKNVLPKIIHHNQTGFVKDRYIGETVRSIVDIMDFTAEENFPGLMIFIDFQKPFDIIECCYLQRCLEYERMLYAVRCLKSNEDMILCWTI